MKVKISLFLFALGLASSASYARPPNWACLQSCTYAYRTCLLSQPSTVCAEQRFDCQANCDDMN